jgi:hypothetical protein
MIPPKIDLVKYDRVGFIGFGCDAEGNLDEFISQRFQETISESQKEAHIIDLGSEEEILKSVGADKLNLEAIRAIGQRYNVKTVFIGSVDIAEVTPIVELYDERIQDIEDIPKPNLEGAGPKSGGWTGAEGRRVNAAVKLSVTAGLWETDEGVVVWTASAKGEEIVNGVMVAKDGKIIFDAREPRFDYRDLVRPLIKAISADFKVKYKRMKKN